MASINCNEAKYDVEGKEEEVIEIRAPSTIKREHFRFSKADHSFMWLPHFFFVKGMSIKARL